ncbi:hypothetical protein QR680_017732 [Steinernema hermaphroditum]|uniref:Cytochrome P450 n=1 Tax=Steinernema hermaphroditum TaxID=289476 RepID=A0AA39LP67_9BILA|nr:hypothetical protein QR680_017732 [Steinernema hermaphroditum]
MLGLVVFVVFALLIAYLYHRRRAYPPGPFPLPLFGNLHVFVFFYLLWGHNVGDVMLRWKRRFGAVFTVWFGPIPFVVVADYDVAVQTYVRDAETHSDRFNVSLFELMRESHGIIMSNGMRWLEQRRFALRVLRDFGVGKNLMQQMILREYHQAMDPLDEELLAAGGRKKIEPRAQFLDVLAGSVINSLMVGYSFDESNIEEFREMRAAIERGLREFNLLDFVLLNSYTKNLPLLKDRFRKVMEIQDKPLCFVMRQISNRRAEIESGKHELDESAPRDFLDAYLLEMRRREAADGTVGDFTEKQLAFAILDIWQAGMDTTIATVSWAFAFLATHPDVQEKMREELWRVVGKNRDVELSDKVLLPYSSAVVTETYRLSALLNVNIWRQTTKECSIGGHRVLKGTANAAMMCVIFRDESVFEKPKEFNPERFIDDKQLEQKVIPFGLGKRQCLGEGLARAEVFLTILNVIKSYRLIDEDGTVEWRKGTEFGFARVPFQYEIAIEKA